MSAKIDPRRLSSRLFSIGLMFVFHSAVLHSVALPDDFEYFASALQDTTSSPSDAQVDADASQTDAGSDAAGQDSAARGQITDLDDGGQTIQPIPQSDSSALQPTPRNQPNVASLGNNQFNTLTSSSVYSGAILASLGGGSSSTSSYFGSAAHRNLLDTPEMFGDFRRPGSSILFDPMAMGGYYLPHGETARPSDFPSAASFSGLRISENNVALPQDRVWFAYNHMHNAFAQPGGDLSLDRFTLGIEKTFHDGSHSIEVRLPIAGSIDPAGTFGGSTAYAGGSFGNLSVILKRVLYASDRKVLAAGLAVETPTGSQSHALDNGAGQAAITIDPTAVYLTPYLGCLCTFHDIWFLNSFLQVDVPTNGERMLASLGGNPAQTFYINKPTTLQFDLGLGVWLLTPGESVCGLALTNELHVATALQEQDSFVVDPLATFPNVFVNQDSINTLVNYTTGLHAQLNDDWSVRVGVSAPFMVQRIFDTELLVQVNRNY